MAKKANKSSKFNANIQREQLKRGLKNRTLKQEVKTRFTATHTMICSFMNDPNKTVSEANIDEEKVMENVHAFNAALKASVSRKDFDALAITDDNIAKFLKVVPSLDSMEEAIRYLGGDQHVTGSSVLPFLISFNTSLEADE